jgi:cytidylate kinase
MPVITISRGSYSKGKEVAEKVAQKLGYECISREILIEASEEFNISEMKLIRAIHDSPSILDSFSSGKERYIAYIQAALLEHFRKDNVIYHGLAGHFFVKDIPHVLKVRIIADLEGRVRLEMERKGIAEKEALQILKKDDEERRKWSRHLYGIDTWDSSLYDLVIRIHKITVQGAVDIICRTVNLKDFQTTPETKKTMDDLALAAQVKAALMEIKLDIHVTAKNGVISVTTSAPYIQEKALTHRIEDIGKKIPGVKYIKTRVIPFAPYGE